MLLEAMKTKISAAFLLTISLPWRHNPVHFVLEFNVFGWGPVVVTRYMEGEQLVWEYADGSKTYMDRICRLPEEHKVPARRGRRIKVY